MVRAKFKVTQIVTTDYGQGLTPSRKVVLEPQYDMTIAEDQRFAKATPSGRIEMQIDNPAALTYLAVGSSFYVDFNVVEQAVPA